jgi:exosortase
MNIKNITISASSIQTHLLSASLLLGSFIFLYYGVIISLYQDWMTDENYSHGILILPIALYFLWERRSQLNLAQRKPALFGLIAVTISILILFAGMLGSELFLTRISILGTIAGTILFLYGWNHLKILIFPILFLLLMIPIPQIIFNHITFPLQLLASRFGELVLSTVGIPVLREGNIIQLANTSLEVVEACSGIRSLISLLTLGILYGYFADSRNSVRMIMALATIPIAILANGIRVAITGIAADYYGPAAVQGFLHTFSGWVIFLIAFLMLFALQRLIKLLAPLHLRRTAPGRCLDHKEQM